MAELLVRVRDKINDTSPILDAKCTKAGDVIHIAENGHQWGIEELQNPDWRIIKVPDATVEDLQFLLSPELPPDLNKQYLMLRLRANKLDLNKIGIVIGNLGTESKTLVITNDGRQVNAIDTISLNKDTIINNYIVKIPLVEPNVIGPSETIIGPR